MSYRPTAIKATALLAMLVMFSCSASAQSLSPPSMEAERPISASFAQRGSTQAAVMSTHEHVTAKVNLVESTYMPGTVAFMLSGGSALCPAGSWLSWQRDAENNKSVYAMLMAALTSGKQVTVIFDQGDGNCVPKFMHLVDR